MATIVTMPAVLADAREAALQSWLVAAGDSITKGQALAEIETDKATFEIESEHDGTVSQILAEAGTTVEVGGALALIAQQGDTDTDLARALADVGVDQQVADASAPPAVPTDSPTADVAPAAPAGATPSAASDARGERIFASPLVRKIARAHDIPLEQVNGSGPRGRIIRSDVERFLREEAPVATAPAADTAASAAPTPAAALSGGAGAFEDVPVSRMRRAIARRLGESKSTVPHFYATVDARLDPLLDLRSQINESRAPHEPKVSVNDLLLKALGLALAEVPDANVTWQGDAIRRYRDVDVAVAIATPDGGLLTPVVRDIGRRALGAVVGDMADFKQRAAEGRIKQHELEGGSFSLSNLGMYGVREFAAIINPPHAGILAVGAGQQRPVVVDGSIEVATVMTCTLSADHRAIDGAVGARLLAAFASRVEQPLSILL